MLRGGTALVGAPGPLGHNFVTALKLRALFRASVPQAWIPDVVEDNQIVLKTKVGGVDKHTPAQGFRPSAPSA